MAIVYWIRHPDHTDIFTEGYIGFSSKSLDERYTKHICDATGKNKRNYRLHNAIRKYGENFLVTEVLVVGDDSYCLNIEEKLRPNKNIGWNHNIGGSKPPCIVGRMFSEESIEKLRKAHTGKILSQETRDKISAVQIGRTASDETRHKMSKARLGTKVSYETKQRMSKAKKSACALPWLSHLANDLVWSKALEISNALINSTIVGAKSARKMFGFKTDGAATSLIKKLKSGWNPSEDASYLAWLSEYKQKQELANGT